MKEGIFFPDFWTDQQKQQWLNHFIKTKQLADINSENTKKWPNVDWLRNLYLHRRSDFFEIRQLFKLFGIQVHVNRNPGLFDIKKPHKNACIVCDKRTLDIQQLIQQHPVVNALSAHSQLLTYNNLFGLVLDRVTQLNSQVTVDKLKQLFRSCHVNTKVISDINSNNDSSISPQITYKLNLRNISVYLPLLPLPAGIFRTTNSKIITLKSYSQKLRNFLDNSVPNHPDYLLVNNLFNNLQPLFNLELQNETFIKAKILRKSLDIELGQDAGDWSKQDNELLQVSYFVQQQLLPQRITQYLVDYVQNLDTTKQTIFEEALMNENMALEQIAQQLQQPMEEIRQSAQDYAQDFSQWWDQLSFTNRLLVENQCQPFLLSDYFDVKYVRLIAKTILQENQELKNIWQIEMKEKELLYS